MTGLLPATASGQGRGAPSGGQGRGAPSGATLAAFTRCAPIAVRAELYVASLAWGQLIYKIETGLSGRAVVFDERQWRGQARAAQGRCAPCAVPYQPVRRA